MILSRLLSFLPNADKLPPLAVESITEDSRAAAPNGLFVCIKGALSDGHCYAENAYENGCRIFLAEHSLPLPADATIIEVPDTRMALGLAADAFYAHPSQQLKLIGITGTKGKTTTACLIHEILNRNGVHCGYIGTNGISYFETQKPLKNTTPDAVTLQRTLAEMRDAGCQAAVIEVSSQALLQHRVAGIQLYAALFTNLSPDHIGSGEHTSFEEYEACKHQLFTDYHAEIILCNADDPHTKDMLLRASAKKIVSCSTQKKADYSAFEISSVLSEHLPMLCFYIRHGKKQLACRLPLVGRGNVDNALLAVACAEQCFGIPPEVSVPQLESIHIAGRSEWISLPVGAYAVIDYAHNDVSLRQLLQDLRVYATGRLICLFGSVGGRTDVRRKALGSVAAELSDLCILTSDNPAEESPQQIIQDILKGFEGFSTPYLSIPDRAEAIQTAVQMLCAGDVLVLAGKGHENYQLIGTKKLPFCERDLIEEALSLKLI